MKLSIASRFDAQDLAETIDIGGWFSYAEAVYAIAADEPDFAHLILSTLERNDDV